MDGTDETLEFLLLLLARMLCAEIEADLTWFIIFSISMEEECNQQLNVIL